MDFEMTKITTPVTNRRDVLAAAGTLAAAAFASPAIAQAATSPAQGMGLSPATISQRRKLGTLEVSSIGLGVQNMSRTYQTTVPTRSEMHNIIRTAFDRGVTLFDAAEAYGPFEVEKILGEAVEPFRNQIVIETKFGWNLDLETGQMLPPGLNSKPEHIKQVVEAMLKRLRTDRIDMLYQHRVDPQVPIEDVAGAIKDLKAEGKVLEPLDELFKDEVRAVGRVLGLPDRVVNRHPFPGPGLAVRCPGEVTAEKLEIIREADKIYIDLLHKHGFYNKVWQAYAAIIPTKTVGVKGDERCYEYALSLRAVTSEDAMTAEWVHLPHELLGEISSKILNEVKGVNRVLYDISTKPPASIEWE